jgi:hypothetical protein
MDYLADGPDFLRRLTLGIITLLGLYHGLKHLAIAASLSQSGLGELPPEASLGLLIAATLAASVAAGTVNRRAELTGLLLALGACAAFIGPELALGVSLPEEWLFGVPILLSIIGLIGGLAGRLMVPPAPRVPLFGSARLAKVTKADKIPARIVWWRVAVGVGVVVVGTVYADGIRQVLSKALSGQAGSLRSSALLAWQISMIVAALGGVLAGMNTRSGLRQGLVSGLVAAIGAVIVIVNRGINESPLVEFWTEQLTLTEVGAPLYAALGATVLAATAIGGWLGAQVLPPLDRR